MKSWGRVREWVGRQWPSEDPMVASISALPREGKLLLGLDAIPIQTRSMSKPWTRAAEVRGCDCIARISRHTPISIDNKKPSALLLLKCAAEGDKRRRNLAHATPGEPFPIGLRIWAAPLSSAFERNVPFMELWCEAERPAQSNMPMPWHPDTACVAQGIENKTEMARWSEGRTTLACYGEVGQCSMLSEPAIVDWSDAEESFLLWHRFNPMSMASSWVDLLATAPQSKPPMRFAARITGNNEESAPFSQSALKLGWASAASEEQRFSGSRSRRASRAFHDAPCRVWLSLGLGVGLPTSESYGRRPLQRKWRRKGCNNGCTRRASW